MLLAIVVLILARGVWGVYEKERDTSIKLEQARQDHVELEQQKAFLEEDNARLNTPHGVEEEIRDKYGLGKAGEEVIIVVTPEGEAGDTDTGEGGIWQNIRSWFQ